MFSTDGGEFLYHTKSHLIRFLVFFTLMLFLSFFSLRFWHSTAYLFYIVILGFLIWALCQIITGKEEAVDAGFYLPLALLITGIISSLPSPKFFFSGALGIFVGQVAFMAFIPTGFGANLWPITAVMLVPAMLISMFGGVIVYIVSRKRSSGNQESSKYKTTSEP